MEVWKEVWRDEGPKNRNQKNKQERKKGKVSLRGLKRKIRR